MNLRTRSFGIVTLAALLGCEGFGGTVQAGQEPAPEKKPGGRTGSIQSRPSRPAPSAEEAKVEGDKLLLTGLTLTLPGGWTSQPIEAPGPMAPKAVFKIQNDKGDGGMVRITHYPNMKGKDKDEMNIDRWLAQVTQPDGTPSTRAQANIETAEVGQVRLTMVDLSGAVKLTMRDTPKEGMRMIAAIVDHPKGPHFVVAAGPADLIAKSKEQIVGFLKSAKVN